jgi:thermitase
MARKELRRKGMGIRVLPQHLTITGALALALCLLLFGAGGSNQAHALVEDYRPGEVVVRLHPGVAIEQILADYPSFSLQRLDEHLPYNLETENIYLLGTTDDRDAKTVADSLATDARVKIAEPNYVTEVPEAPAGGARHKARGITYRKQSSKANHTFAEKLNLSSCARDVRGATVAVLDTGAQLNHPALRGNFRGVERFDFVENDPTPSDIRVRLDVDGNRLKDQMWGHGTHVAGIVDRVAPGAKIMPLRVLDSEGYGDVYDIARAISFARGHGANVINLSLGTPTPSKLLREMVAETTSPEYNIVVAAAAGNAGIETPHYPAAGDYRKHEGPLPEVPSEPPTDGLLAVISVETAKDSWKKSDFANYGFWVGIAAPGEDIRSAFPGDRYANWSGTSMATPFISGQAALIHAFNGSISSENIEEKMRSNARQIQPENPDYPLKVGAGHANVCGSL